MIRKFKKSLNKDLNLSDVKRRGFTPAHWFKPLNKSR